MTSVNYVDRLKEEIDFLHYDKYHHPIKGCDTRVVWLKKDRRLMCNVICVTHKVACSKTGWELGWYLGTNSKQIWDECEKKYKLICLSCKKEFRSSYPNQLYCSKICQSIANGVVAK